MRYEEGDSLEDEYYFEDQINHDAIAAKVTIADRTFKLGKYSITISKYDYAILYNAHYAESLYDDVDYYYNSGDSDIKEPNTKQLKHFPARKKLKNIKRNYIQSTDTLLKRLK